MDVSDISQQDQFQTERLHVQSWAKLLCNPRQRSLLVDALEAILTPAVLRNLPALLQVMEGPEPVDKWILARAAESHVMTIRGVAQDDLLGLLILAEFAKPRPCTEVHLGYLLRESAWGKGYATEVVAGLVGWYRGRYRCTRILGGVEKENVASAEVLRKNGFKRAGHLSSGSTDVFSLVI